MCDMLQLVANDLRQTEASRNCSPDSSRLFCQRRQAKAVRTLLLPTHTALNDALHLQRVWHSK